MNRIEDVTNYITECDEEVGKALQLELGRQRRNLELIASENIVSPAVMLAMGTVPTNKYAEGYPGKRYYGGCEDVDILENLAIERAKKLFGCDHVCVQPHSGANANTAVYQALIKPGDTVMGLNLAHGGHLTHGSPVNLSGILYNFVPYNVNDDGVLDYDAIRKLARECKPKDDCCRSFRLSKRDPIRYLCRYCKRSWSLSFRRYGTHCRSCCKQDFTRARFLMLM